MKKRLNLKKISIICLVVFMTIFAGFMIYVNDYYHATDDVLQYLESTEEVNVTINDNIIFNNEKNDVGIIFYPGAKVEAKAYSKLMFDLALNGFDTFLISMPFNLAFFGMNEASKIINKHSEITKWYVMGHSLGGAIVANYASKNADKINGVILLAAYSTSDLRDIDVLSIYGENDLVLNSEKYQDNLKNLPKTFEEVIIPGGNHAGFGMYGVQVGDGNLTISVYEQISITVSAICDFIN